MMNKEIGATVVYPSIRASGYDTNTATVRVRRGCHNETVTDIPGDVSLGRGDRITAIRRPNNPYLVYVGHGMPGDVA